MVFNLRILRLLRPKIIFSLQQCFNTTAKGGMHFSPAVGQDEVEALAALIT
jgi:hypothetical protein